MTFSIPTLSSSLPLSKLLLLLSLLLSPYLPFTSSTASSSSALPSTSASTSPSLTSSSPVINTSISPIPPIQTLNVVNFTHPYGVVYDGLGNLYITDDSTNLITKMTTAGVVLSTLTFNPPLNSPSQLAIDSQGFLYVADQGNQRVVKFTGNGAQVAVFTAPGTSLSFPLGVAVDTAFRVYVVDTYNDRIVQFNSNGSVSSVITSTLSTAFALPSAIAVDAAGTLFIADTGNNRLVVRYSSGTQSVLYSALASPVGVAVDVQFDYVFIADSANSRIVQISSAGILLQVLTTTSPALSYPAGLALDGAGNLFVCDVFHGRVLRFNGVDVVRPGPGVSSVFPTPIPLYLNLLVPYGLAIDAVGSLYLSVSATETIVKFIPGISVLASFTPSPSLYSPRGIAVDSLGNIWIADEGNDALVKLSPTGARLANITTTAPALNLPLAVAVDLFDNVYLTDQVNQRVVQFAPNGTVLSIITTSRPSLVYPTGVAVDSSGVVYISDNNNNRVVKVYPNKTVVTLFTSLNNPQTVVLDWMGNAYISDLGNSRVVQVSPAGVLLATFTAATSPIQPQGLVVDALGNLYVIDGAAQRVIQFAAVTLPIPPSATVSSLLNATCVVFSDGGYVGVNASSFSAQAQDENLEAYPILIPALGVPYTLQSVQTIFAPNAGQSAMFRIGVWSAMGVLLTQSAAMAYYGTANVSVLSVPVSPYTLPAASQPATLYVGMTIDNQAVVNHLSAQAVIYSLYSGEYTLPPSTPLPATQQFYFRSVQYTVVPYQVSNCPASATNTTNGVPPVLSSSSSMSSVSSMSSSRPSSSSTAGLTSPAPPPTYQSSGPFANVSNPRGLVVDSFGYVYVTSNNFLVKFSSSGVVVGNFSLGLSGPVGAGLAIDSMGFLYVVDEPNQRVVKFNSSGSLVRSFTGFYGPSSVFVDSADRLWVPDTGNRRVVELSPNGTVLSTINGSSLNPGFTFPNTVAVDGAGNVFISDYTDYRVIKRFPNGTSVVFFTLNSLDAIGLAFDLYGSLFIADFFNNRVVELNTVTDAIVQVITGTASNGLIEPIAVALDSHSNLYVANNFAGRIDRFIGVSGPSPFSSSSSMPSPTSMPATSTPTSPPILSGTLCYMLYASPGGVDYPFSVATVLNFQYYNPSNATTGTSPAVAIVSGSGARTYTNRFGTSFSTPLTVLSTGSNLLYLNSSYPLDSSGLSLSLASPVQLPGASPSVAYSTLTVSNSSFNILFTEGAPARIDGQGEAFLSSVPGFLNVTIGAGNGNALAVDYSQCKAPISFANGVRPPTQPSTSNGALHIAYSYAISDGVSYSVVTNLTLTAMSAFANSQDQLSNNFQVIVNITGTRTYTFLPTAASVTSMVSSTPSDGTLRFHPYALLSSSPGVYSISTAPFLDADGLTFAISPPAPVNGNQPGGNTSQVSVIAVRMTTYNNSVTLLNEATSAALPLQSLQQQLYLLLL